MTAEVIKELKQDYSHKMVSDSILFKNMNASMTIGSDGTTYVQGPGFTVTERQAKDELLIAFFKDPFSYYEFKAERFSELLKYFYEYKKDKNIEIYSIDSEKLRIRYSNLDVIPHVTRNCWIDFRSGKIER